VVDEGRRRLARECDMTLHSYLLFVLASVLLVLVPGPDMLYMLARCVAQGRRAGALAACVFSAGSYVHLTAAMIGLSAVLATSSVAFSVVKWLGGAYLIYLGIGTLRGRQESPQIGTEDRPRRTGRTIFWQAFVNNVLNPKVAM